MHQVLNTNHTSESSFLSSPLSPWLSSSPGRTYPHSFSTIQPSSLQVYEEIAGHFSETRHKPWPRVTQFISTIPVRCLTICQVNLLIFMLAQNGGIILDLGCGNGKYLGQEEEDGRSRFEVGADYSQNLLAIVRERGHQALRCAVASVQLPI